MHNLDIVGESTEIDALTITAMGLEGKLSISLVIDSLTDYLDLHKQKKWKFQGAEGWSKGGVSSATRYNKSKKAIWTVLMVRGEIARAAMDVAMSLDDIKYTRVDIRVDLAMAEKVEGLPRKLKDSYRGKFPVQLIESNTGDTFYCGSRESGSFIRIYDKSSAYGYPAGSGMVWRFEIEFKKGTACGVVELLKEGKFENASDIVWQALRSRDIPAPKIGRVLDIRSTYTNLTSAEMKLEWIGRQVRPTVEFLVALGLKDEVKQQLGLFDDAIDVT